MPVLVLGSPPPWLAAEALQLKVYFSSSRAGTCLHAHGHLSYPVLSSPTFPAVPSPFKGWFCAWTRLIFVEHYGENKRFLYPHLCGDWGPELEAVSECLIIY